MYSTAALTSLGQPAFRGTAHPHPKPCLTRRRNVSRPNAQTLDQEFMQHVTSSLEQLTDSLNRVERGQGGMVERQLRGDIKHHFGDQYSKRLLARSIMDFAHLFKDQAIQPKLNDVEDRPALLMPAIQVLVDTKEVERLVVSLHALLARSGLNPGNWVINESSLDIDVTAFGTFLGSLKNGTLRRTFERIKRYLEAQDKMIMMRSCDGPGILALISAALAKDGKPCFPADVQINDLNSLVEYLPNEDLELDCRGNLDVTLRNSAYIDIGEVKTGADYSKATTQLGTRLSAIAWLVHECCEVPDADITRVGRLFIPLGKRQPIASQEQKFALDVWQFSLYLHEI